MSNLSFISKIIERAAYKQIYGYLQENRLLPEKQSAYRRYHSTETAVLDVLSDAFMAADAGKVTLLGLLDESSAFDMVDHKILLRRLKMSYGICGLPLQWITSYLSGRTQYVQFNGRTSEVALITCGVPPRFRIGSTSFHCLYCGSNWRCGQVWICSSRLCWWSASPYPCGSTRISWDCADFFGLCWGRQRLDVK